VLAGSTATCAGPGTASGSSRGDAVADAYDVARWATSRAPRRARRGPGGGRASAATASTADAPDIRFARQGELASPDGRPLAARALAEGGGFVLRADGDAATARERDAAAPLGLHGADGVAVRAPTGPGGCSSSSRTGARTPSPAR
jgi:hypothetical protein